MAELISEAVYRFSGVASKLSTTCGPARRWRFSERWSEADYARSEMVVIPETLQVRSGALADLLKPPMLRIVISGSLLGIFSQISGVNAVTIDAP